MSARRHASSGAPWEGRYGYAREVRSGSHAYVVEPDYVVEIEAEAIVD